MDGAYHFAHFEDDLILRDLIKEVLEVKGHRCTHRSALKHEEIGDFIFQIGGLEKIDCVLTDGWMGEGMDGFKLANEFRSRGYGGPIIFMTGDVNLLDKADSYREKGIFNGVLKKPFALKELYGLIGKYLNGEGK